jgi:DNA (cytosine-5)-methyltransferase 1
MMNTRPRLLDLFCGAGGAAMGYHRAGFDVVGVDIAPQKRYPFTFVQADALEYCAAHGHEFDVIHASPPCQVHSRLKALHAQSEYFDKHLDLVPQTRELLQSLGKPYVIENVMGAPLINPTILCGTMFDLGCVCKDGQYRQLWRHRQFEMSFFCLTPTCQHRGEPIGVYGNGGAQAKTVWNGGPNRGYMGAKQERIDAMRIDWMNNAELSQAIPPAYTEYIGRQLLQALSMEVTA